jgi:hypothetical protein
MNGSYRLIGGIRVCFAARLWHLTQPLDWLVKDGQICHTTFGKPMGGKSRSPRSTISSGCRWRRGWQCLDPIIALIVAVNIVWIGVQLVRRSALGLLDTALPKTERAAVRQILERYQQRGAAVPCAADASGRGTPLCLRPCSRARCVDGAAWPPAPGAGRA